jgi:hypothetical protein
MGAARIPSNRYAPDSWQRARDGEGRDLEHRSRRGAAESVRVGAGSPRTITVEVK